MRKIRWKRKKYEKEGLSKNDRNNIFSRPDENINVKLVNYTKPTNNFIKHSDSFDLIKINYLFNQLLPVHITKINELIVIQKQFHKKLTDVLNQLNALQKSRINRNSKIFLQPAFQEIIGSFKNILENFYPISPDLLNAKCTDKELTQLIEDYTNSPKNKAFLTAITEHIHKQNYYTNFIQQQLSKDRLSILFNPTFRNFLKNLSSTNLILPFTHLIHTKNLFYEALKITERKLTSPLLITSLKTIFDQYETLLKYINTSSTNESFNKKKVSAPPPAKKNHFWAIFNVFKRP